MAYTGKNFLDLTGLTAYDEKIKNYIDTADALAIKFAKISTDGNTLLLYKDKNASAASTEESADFKISMGSSALRSLVESLGTAAGATLNSSTDTYSVTFTGDIAAATSIVGACNLLDTHIGTLASLTTTEKTNIVGAINEIVTAIANLDVDEFALATASNGVVTIKGIKEVDGKIAVGTDTTKDVTFAKVATTGDADDVAYSTGVSVKDALDTLNGDDTTAGSVAKAVKDGIDGLDVTEFALASVNNNVVNIKGIKEVDGKIAVGDSAGINLEEVAYTGAAADVSTAAITDGDATDPKTLYAAGTAQGTLEAIARDLNDLTSESVVDVEKQTTAETGYFATYVVKQNGTQVGAKINIPMDFLVKSATVEVVTTDDVPYTGARVGDKYIDFVINVKEGTATDEHIYIPVNDLVHPLSGGTTTVANMYELQVSVSNTNQITATLNNIYAAKVSYVPTSQTTVLTSVTNVGGALDAIDTLIQGMDADLDASTSTATDASGIAPLAVMTGVTEVDGTVTTIDSGAADAYGTATAVYNAIGSIATADINALFSAS